MRIFFTFFLGFVLCACNKKEDLKQPVELNIYFSLEEEPESGPGSGPGLQIESLTIGLEGFALQAQRTRGEDIGFERIFAEKLLLEKEEFASSSEKEELRIELPNGEYERLILDIDLSDFRLEGFFYTAQEEQIRIDFRFSGQKNLALRIEEPHALRAKEPKKLLIHLSPAAWFRQIPPGLLRNAQRERLANGQRLIRMDAQTNPALYNYLNAKIEKELRAMLRGR